jgi:hypothetical protein
MIEIKFIYKEQVEQAWPFVEKWLQEATYVYPGYTANDIKVALLEGRHHLWLVFSSGELTAAFTTAIHIYPSAKVVEAVHLGGTGVESWIEKVADAVAEFGKINECSSVIMTGRPGFEKVYKKCGFVKAAVFLRRDINV